MGTPFAERWPGDNAETHRSDDGEANRDHDDCTLSRRRLCRWHRRVVASRVKRARRPLLVPVDDVTNVYIYGIQSGRAD